MITRQVKLQLLVFALIAAFGLTYTGARYADLDRFFVSQGYVVAADFADSGGIFEGAEVTYRGVPVGEVQELELRPDGVRVHLLVENETSVPMGSRAVVANRSAVGEQYVDLQPLRAGEPWLKDGDVIPQSDTSIPIQPTELLVNLDDFVNSVDTEDVRIVLTELGTAFDGAGDDLQRLVDNGDLLTQAATEALPETLTLIRDGRVALDTQRDVAGQFRSFNEDLASLSAQLRASDPDFRALFANGTQSAVAVTDLVESNRAALPILIQNLLTTAQVQAIRLPAISQVLVTYPNVIAGGFTVTPGDGAARFGLVTSMEPGICDVTLPDGRGYETVERPFADIEADGEAPQPGNQQAFCALPPGSPESVRGSQNQPRPEGFGPFQGPGTGGYPAGFPLIGPEGGAQAGAVSPNSASEPTELVLADYDPRTGRTITSDGRVFSVGSTAGASQVFGSRSWEWMLVAPLSR